MSIGQDDFQNIHQFNIYKRKILNEITQLKLLINQKNGFWIFESYSHDPKSLLDSKHYNKINALVGTVASNVTNWAERGNISKIVYDAYQNFVRDIENEIITVNNLIVYRKPTGWEKFIKVAKAVGALILNRFPSFIVSYLTANTIDIKLLPSWNNN